jgi:hypothetical protein
VPQKEAAAESAASTGGVPGSADSAEQARAELDAADLTAAEGR